RHLTLKGSAPKKFLRVTSANTYIFLSPTFSFRKTAKTMTNYILLADPVIHSVNITMLLLHAATSVALFSGTTLPNCGIVGVSAAARGSSNGRALLGTPYKSDPRSETATGAVVGNAGNRGNHSRRSRGSTSS
ncbi:unnamed protein product, partial [Amoebophrya sp. A25]